MFHRIFSARVIKCGKFYAVIKIKLKIAHLQCCRLGVSLFDCLSAFIAATICSKEFTDIFIMSLSTYASHWSRAAHKN